MRNFDKLNIDVRGHGSGRVKTFCPFCHGTRHNKRDRSLSVDIDKGLYLCHYCGAKGYVPAADGEGWVYFDYTPGELTVRRGGADVIGRICVIGSALKEEALKELFRIG